MSKLMCLAGMNKGDEFALAEGNNVLGRTGDATIVLFDKKCSRLHCQVVKKGSYYSVEDLSSRNGTFLNGKQLRKATSMKPGDKIRIGKTILELSEKAVGNLLEQTATEVAADLQGRQYQDLVSNAAAAVVLKHDKSDQGRGTTQTGLRGLLRRLFNRGE